MGQIQGACICVQDFVHASWVPASRLDNTGYLPAGWARVDLSSCKLGGQDCDWLPARLPRLSTGQLGGQG